MATVVPQLFVKKGFQCLASLSALLIMELEGSQYNNISVIQKSVTGMIPFHELEKAMKQLEDHTEECIRTNGDYFE